MTHLRQLCCLILLLLGAAGSGLRADSVVGASGVATPPSPTASDPVPEASAVRVISQTLGSDELLLAVASPGQIVALSHLARDARYSSIANEAAGLPQLSPTCDAETALALRPTLILCADYSRPELINQVRKAGIRVLIFSKYSSLEDAYANLRMLARELGAEAEARAERVIAESKERVQRLARRLEGVKPVRVLAPSVYGLIPGSHTTFQDLCDHAGAENVAHTLGGLRGHQPPPSERLLSWPVDRVVVSGATVAEGLAPYKAMQPYSFMAAVREGRAVAVRGCILSCISHHRVDGYEELARALHPERFDSAPASGGSAQ